MQDSFRQRGGVNCRVFLERLDDPRAVPAILALVDSPSRDVAARAMDVAAQHPEPRVAVALTAILVGCWVFSHLSRRVTYYL